MTRTLLIVSTVVLLSGCTATPLITKERMTLGEANISGMECRRETSVRSSMPKTTCASPELWAKYDARENEKTELFFGGIRDGDNRMLGRGR
jgi:hypothetical protein